MHISRVRVQNFRCFKDTSIDFQPGLNVIIGENNAGKTALLTAMRLILDRKKVSLTHHDFHYESLATDTPPAITVTFTLSSDTNDTPEDRAVVATWLTRFGENWEASISCLYELPEEFHEAYGAARNNLSGTLAEKSQHAIEVMQEQGRFVLRYFGGVLENRFMAEPEWLSHFEGRHLDAIRDAEEDLRSGRATLLRRMLRSVLDAKKDGTTAAQSNQNDFRARAAEVMTNVRERLNIDHLFELAVRTWSSVSGNPTLSGRITEGDLLESIVLLLDHTSHQHPVSHGGLGYNNLLYVALVLASMRPIDGKSRALTDTAHHALLVEEPEAHLHPALQYRFLAFLKQQIEKDVDSKQLGSRQLFLTSHSTHVTAAVGLDALRCLYLDEHRRPRVAYPGRAFGPKYAPSKVYVERFLDATKSAMLFSKAVLFVEGISELLLVPRLADFVLDSGEEPGLLDRNYVAVVRVDGVTFHHFLPLFGLTDEDDAANGLIDRCVAILSDGDPGVCRMAKGPLAADETVEDEEDVDLDHDIDIEEAKAQVTKRRRKCWPFEANATQSDMASELLSRMNSQPNRLKVGIAKKTFEYDLAHANHQADILVTDALPVRIRPHLRALMSHTEEGRQDGTEPHWRRWRPSDATALAKSIDTLDSAEIRRARVGAFFLRAVENSKGTYASSLATVLSDELKKPHAERATLALPEYIIEPLKFVCRLETPAAWKR